MPPMSKRYRPKNITFRPDTLLTDPQSPDVLFLADILKEVKQMREDQKEILNYLKEITK